ncbi:MAG: hypothetical protein ABI834_00100 [Ginsengibacter sp.]
MFLLLATGLCSPAQNIIFSRENTAFLLKNKLNTPGSIGQFTSVPVMSIGVPNVKQIIPSDFYTNNMGFFCKKELVLEKATKIPLRFRLGSLQQCNYYEGKKQ